MNKLGYRIGTIGCFLIAFIALFFPSFRITGIWEENISFFDFIRGYQVPFVVREDMQSVDMAMYGIQVVVIGIVLSIMISVIFLIVNKHIDVIFPLQVVSSAIVFIMMIVVFILGAGVGSLVGISLHVGVFMFLPALTCAAVLARLSRPSRVGTPKPDSNHGFTGQGQEGGHVSMKPSPAFRYDMPHQGHEFCTECGKKVYAGMICPCQMEEKMRNK